MTAGLGVSRLRRASGVSVFGSIASAVFLFWVFRLTVELAGLAVIGSWALIQGLFLFARVADSGAGSNITRYVASYSREGFRGPSGFKVFVTGALLSTVPVGILAIAVGYPIFYYVSNRFAESIAATSVAELTIGAMTLGIISSLSTIALSVLEGLMLLSTRYFINAASNIVGITVAYPAIKGFGPIGLVFSYVVVSIVQLTAGLVIIRLVDHRRGATDSRVSTLAAVLWRENVQLSLIAVVQLAFEPMVKFALSLVAGLGEIASFELALRLVTQLRVLFQSALQPLLAVGARERHVCVQPNQLVRFKSTARLLRKFAWLPFTVLVLFGPIASKLGLGAVSSVFMIYLFVLAIGNLVNVLGMPSYYLLLSGNQLTTLLRVQIAMAVLVVACAAVAIAVSSAMVTVIGYSLAFAAAGIFLIRILVKNEVPSASIMAVEEI